MKHLLKCDIRDCGFPGRKAYHVQTKRGEHYGIIEECWCLDGMVACRLVKHNEDGTVWVEPPDRSMLLVDGFLVEEMETEQIRD